MALPARRRTSFIRRSVQARLGASLTTATGNTYPVVYGAPAGVSDPEGVSDDNGAEARGWYDVTWIADGAGKRSASILQLDVFYRHGGRIGTPTDPYGIELTEMVDAVVELFSGVGGTGLPRWYVPILDFTVPLAPTPTGDCLVCESSAGQPGEIDTLTYLDDRAEVGVWHAVLRLRFRGMQDTAGGAAFYT